MKPVVSLMLTCFLTSQAVCLAAAPAKKSLAMAVTKSIAVAAKSAPTVPLETVLANLAAHPESAEAQLAAGEAYLRAKDYLKAREHLRLAIRLGKGDQNSQKANMALIGMPRGITKPKTGAATRLIASMLGLGRTRGMEAAKPTVIDFFAAWCVPCKQLDTVMGKMKVAYSDKVNFMKVDVDDPSSQELLDQYEVSPIPTVVFLNTDGEVVTYTVGYSGETSVKDGITKILTAAK